MTDKFTDVKCCGQKLSHRRHIDYETECTIDIYFCEICGQAIRKITNYIEHNILAGTDD